MTETIDFLYDVVCPYAYLASTRIDAAAQRVGAQVRWRPVLLGGLFAEVGGVPDPNAVMPAAKLRLTHRDMERWADLYGVPLQRPAAHPRRTVNAMRLCVLAEDGPQRIAVSRALLSAYWVEGRDVADSEVLADIARRHGLDPAEIEAPATKQRLREATAEAAGQGAFGVPTFVTRRGLWWGQDRLPLALAALGGTVAIDRAPQPVPPTPGGRVELFHDFASPFSYLASTAIEAVCARHDVAVTWTPILLGGLFRAIGTPDVPMFEMPAVKQAYVRRDMEDWAAARGVPFRFPTHFPIRSVLPLRVALAEPRLTPVLYRAAWGEDRRIDDPASIRAVIRDAGFSSDAVAGAGDDPRLKAQLRANTERAVELGVCGVPTMHVRAPGGASLLLWGQDRLGMLDAVLGGALVDRG